MKKFLSAYTKSQKSFILQILFATSFTTLTSGVFLSGLAILMGANDVLVSYISVITNVCGIFVLMFASHLERSQSQKKLTIWLTALSKLATLSIVLIPICVGKQFQLYLLVPLILLAFTLQGLSTVALNNWLAFYTPDTKRGRYISIRQALSLIASVVISILAGRYLDASPVRYWGFVVLFAVALVMAVTELAVLVKIDDTCIVTASKVKYRIKDVFISSVKNKKFFWYVLFVAAFYLFLCLSDSFTILFMSKYLQLPYTTMTILQMIITLPQIFLLGIWGKLSDKYGHKTVLQISIWFFAGETLFLFLTSSANWFICIPIAFFIASVANAGFVISVFNRRYEIIPAQGRMLYDSFFNAVVGIAFICGPSLGGLLREFILSHTVLQNALQFSEIRLLYAVSTIGILLIQIIYLIAGRKQKGEEKTKNS